MEPTRRHRRGRTPCAPTCRVLFVNCYIANANRANAQSKALRGTITVVAVGHSIGIKLADNSSFWARVPNFDTRNLRVGQRVEVVGEWQKEFFIARSLRVQ